MADVVISLSTNILWTVGLAIATFYALVFGGILLARVIVIVRDALRFEWARHQATGSADTPSSAPKLADVDDDDLSEADTAIFHVPQNRGERFRRFDVDPRSKRAH